MAADDKGFLLDADGEHSLCEGCDEVIHQNEVFKDPDAERFFCSEDCWREWDDERRGEEHEARYDLDDDDRSMFADPGGRSALRAETVTNPRNLACPSCGEANVLTPADRAHRYQCDTCADRAEGRIVD